MGSPLSSQAKIPSSCVDITNSQGALFTDCQAVEAALWRRDGQFVPRLRALQMMSDELRDKADRYSSLGMWNSSLFSRQATQLAVDKAITTYQDYFPHEAFLCERHAGH